MARGQNGVEFEGPSQLSQDWSAVFSGPQDRNQFRRGTVAFQAVACAAQQLQRLDVVDVPACSNRPKPAQFRHRLSHARSLPKRAGNYVSWRMAARIGISSAPLCRYSVPPDKIPSRGEIEEWKNDVDNNPYPMETYGIGRKGLSTPVPKKKVKHGDSGVQRNVCLEIFCCQASLFATVENPFPLPRYPNRHQSAQNHQGVEDVPGNRSGPYRLRIVKLAGDKLNPDNNGQYLHCNTQYSVHNEYSPSKCDDAGRDIIQSSQPEYSCNKPKKSLMGCCSVVPV